MSQFAKDNHTKTDKCKCSVFRKPWYLSRIVAWTKSTLTCSASSCSGACMLCQLPREHLMMVWLYLEDWKEKIREKAKWKFNVKMFTLLDVKMIQICTFPAALSTERVLSLAEWVAYLIYSINLRLFNWRVSTLLFTHFCGICLFLIRPGGKKARTKVKISFFSILLLSEI